MFLEGDILVFQNKELCNENVVHRPALAAPAHGERRNDLLPPVNQKQKALSKNKGGVAGHIERGSYGVELRTCDIVVVMKLPDMKSAPMRNRTSSLWIRSFIKGLRYLFPISTFSLHIQGVTLSLRGRGIPYFGVIFLMSTIQKLYSGFYISQASVEYPESVPGQGITLKHKT